MNKEETVDSRQTFLKKWLDLIEKNEDGTQAVYNAMAEYAKEQAIGFMVWAVENYSISYEGFSLNLFNDKRMPTIWVGSNEVPLDELYTLYLKSKTIKP